MDSEDLRAAAAAAANADTSKAGAFGAAVSLWRGLTEKLFDLEARILVTASATEKQTSKVKALQHKVGGAGGGG